jgi:hypothetical protein
MKRRSILPLALALLPIALAACPGPANPSRLWIALNGSAASLQLTDREPDPF